MLRAMLGVLVGGGLAVGASGAAPDDSQLPPQLRKLVPLCTRLAPPESGDWLAAHHEPGQSFRQFVKQTANRVKRGRNVIYECNMCGSNHLEEADRRPMWLCPHCLAKLCWATGAAPETRFRRLIDFCKKFGLQAEVGFYERSLEALHKP